MTSSILTVAGVLFNWVFNETVLQFGYLITCGTSSSSCSPSIINSINLVWTAFRDISNIVIIGMFTFIAINIILGSKTYGEKKLIARVLIVAVLINFSLLFTKIIIDVSNFTATQFYTAASTNDPDLQDNNPNATATGQTGTGQNGTTAAAGISGAFMKYAGVASFGDTASAVFNIGKNPQGGAWWGLLYGVITALLFLVAAIVLFYGSFLLISRAILMIFLMIMSSVAFATYLLPSSKGNAGYSMWSQALLKNAVFAPLLVLLLWVTLKIGQGFASTTGTLGNAISNPANPLDAAALFGYIIVIGLLFASFRIASSFSTSIGGFNYAAAVPAYSFGAISRVGGFFGRQTVGRAASAVGANFQQKSQDKDRSMFMRQLYDFGAQRAKGVAKKDFNLMRTPVGTAVQKTAGIKKIDALAGKKVGGFEGTQKRIAESAADKAQRMTATPQDQAKVVGDAIKQEIANDPEFARQHKQATDVHEDAQGRLQEQQQQLSDLHNQHAEEMKNIHSELERARAAAASGTAGAAEQVSAAEDRLLEARTRQTTQLQEQTERINNARRETTAAYGDIQSVENAARDRAIATGKIKADDRGRPKIVKAEDTTRDLIRSKFTRAFFTDAENQRLEKLAVKEVGTKKQKKRWEESGFLDALRSGPRGERERPAGGGGRTERAPGEHPEGGGGGGVGDADHGGEGH